MSLDRQAGLKENGVNTGIPVVGLDGRSAISEFVALASLSRIQDGLGGARHFGRNAGSHAAPMH